MVATYIHNHTTGIIPPVQDLELVHRTVYQMWTGILIEEILDYSATEQNRRIIKSQADGDNAFPIFYCPTMVEEGFTGNSTLPPGWHQNYLANWDIFVIYEREFPRRIDKFLEQNRTAIMMDTKGSVLGPLGGSGIAFHNKNHITPAFRPRMTTVGFPHGARPSPRTPGVQGSFEYRGGASNVLFMDGHMDAMADPGDGVSLDIAHGGNDMWIGAQWVNPISP